MQCYVFYAIHAGGLRTTFIGTASSSLRLNNTWLMNNNYCRLNHIREAHHFVLVSLLSRNCTLCFVALCIKAFHLNHFTWLICILLYIHRDYTRNEIIHPQNSRYLNVFEHFFYKLGAKCEHDLSIRIHVLDFFIVRKSKKSGILLIVL